MQLVDLRTAVLRDVAENMVGANDRVTPAIVDGVIREGYEVIAAETKCFERSFSTAYAAQTTGIPPLIPLPADIIELRAGWLGTGALLARGPIKQLNADNSNWRNAVGSAANPPKWLSLYDMRNAVVSPPLYSAATVTIEAACIPIGLGCYIPAFSTYSTPLQFTSVLAVTPAAQVTAFVAAGGVLTLYNDTDIPVFAPKYHKILAHYAVMELSKGFLMAGDVAVNRYQGAKASYEAMLAQMIREFDSGMGLNQTMAPPMQQQQQG